MKTKQELQKTIPSAIIIIIKIASYLVGTYYFPYVTILSSYTALWDLCIAGPGSGSQVRKWRLSKVKVRWFAQGSCSKVLWVLSSQPSFAVCLSACLFPSGWHDLSQQTQQCRLEAQDFVKEAGCERRVLKRCGHKTAETGEWTSKFPQLGEEGSIEWPNLPVWFARY